MKIIAPPAIRDKIELTPEEVKAAVNMWLATKNRRQIVGPLKVSTTTGNGFRMLGELNFPSETGNIRPIINPFTVKD